MTPKEFRANAAGYLDAATTLVRTVSDSFKQAEQLKDERGLKRLECPPAIYVVLAEADERLSRVAGWLLSPDNARLES